MSARGLVAVGPIAGLSAARLLRALVDFGLHLAPLGVSARRERQLPCGTVIARGSGVTGYLLASDGLEAGESDLVSFAKAHLRPGGRLVVRGTYAPVPGARVRSRLVAVKLGRDVEIACRRDLLDARGRRRIGGCGGDFASGERVAVGARDAA